jgi:hypothetical protein
MADVDWLLLFAEETSSPVTHTQIYCSVVECRGWLASTLQRKSHLWIARNGFARPESQFPHSCVWAIYIFPRIGPHTFLQQNRQTDRGNIYKSNECRNWDCGRAIPFLEYLFRIFGIVSLQCSEDLLYLDKHTIIAHEALLLTVNAMNLSWP